MVPDPLDQLPPCVPPPLPFPWPNGFWVWPEPVLPAALDVMIVTTAGLTRAAAETTLPLAWAAAELDEPSVPLVPEDAGVT